MIVAWTKATDPAMAYSAAELLNELGADSQAALQPFVEMLSDEDADARTRAAGVLAVSGPAAKSAIPALTQLLELEENAVVRVSAAVALWKIDDQTGTAVRVLAAALRSDDLEARRRAAWTLGEIGPAAKSAVPALVRALKDSDKTVSDGAGYSLLRIDPTAAP
jgi:HEAT repeat protein